MQSQPTHPRPAPPRYICRLSALKKKVPCRRAGLQKIKNEHGPAQEPTSSPICARYRTALDFTEFSLALSLYPLSVYCFYFVYVNEKVTETASIWFFLTWLRTWAVSFQSKKGMVFVGTHNSITCRQIKQFGSLENMVYWKPKGRAWG